MQVIRLCYPTARTPSLHIQNSPSYHSTPLCAQHCSYLLSRSTRTFTFQPTVLLLDLLLLDLSHLSLLVQILQSLPLFFTQCSPLCPLFSSPLLLCSLLDRRVFSQDLLVTRLQVGIDLLSGLLEFARGLSMISTVCDNGHMQSYAEDQAAYLGLYSVTCGEQVDNVERYLEPCLDCFHLGGRGRVVGGQNNLTLSELGGQRSLGRSLRRNIGDLTVSRDGLKARIRRTRRYLSMEAVSGLARSSVIPTLGVLRRTSVGSECSVKIA
jgi:hypothetical protein